jgi:hypothetical protein
LPQSCAPHSPALRHRRQRHGAGLVERDLHGLLRPRQRVHLVRVLEEVQRLVTDEPRALGERVDPIGACRRDHDGRREHILRDGQRLGAGADGGDEGERPPEEVPRAAHRQSISYVAHRVITSSAPLPGLDAALRRLE